MAIPPFPSQDLAKLVLGYLAEEQLMTAYDEFLLASPYLDVLRNEYDRIFMTSLKSILAEYRAVKIYVETCKPFLLRKKLFQCSNLLEIVKFLIHYVDLNKLIAQEASADKLSPKAVLRDTCDTCYSSICTCNEKSTKTASQIEATSENSIETTALSDLPGNSNTTTSARIITKDLSSGSSSQTSAVLIDSNVKGHLSSKEVQVQQDGPSLSQDRSCTQELSAKSEESKQKIEEFNNIYNLVCSNNSLQPNCNHNKDATSKICTAGTFQDFASGVGSSAKDKVPDSSSTENSVVQSNNNKTKLHMNQITNIKGQSTPQFVLKLGTKSKKSNTTKIDLPKTKILPNPKADEQKIKILSDVKVDNFKSNVKVNKPKTSTPMLQMQTMVLNATPAYKQERMGTEYAYTKDEIMAMPTIILVPATSDSTAQIQSSLNQVSTVQCRNTVTTATTCMPKTSTAKILGPLLIDVTSNDINIMNKEASEPILKEVSKPEEVPIVDLTHNSVPKDANFTTNKTSTPQILPPTRKSSSTPRRTSHVRVLDFTTPRRILHETINEQDGKVAGETIENTDLTQNTLISDKATLKSDGTPIIENSTKENTIKLKKDNWDANLRALAIKNHDDAIMTPKPDKIKIKNTKKISPKGENVCKIDSKTKATPKVRKKKKIKSTENIAETIEELNSPIVRENVKNPIVNVNVITETNWDKGIKENQQPESKSNFSDERVETPENERLSLQNVIGAKLNISDLLETPYKQVLYDIQMETPKFLGPDIPGEPISDIKIMNIPTPMFLNTPKPIQATPYSTRPTDYSSGGSYYKPDDQDYIPPDVIDCPITFEECKEKPLKGEKDKYKSSRPQRKCTKNVSYRSFNARSNDNVDASISSDTSNTNARERKSSKSIDTKNQLRTKKDNKKTINKKVLNKSLKKETPKKIIRIKPFKKTPVKDSPLKGKKKTTDVLNNLSTKILPRKRTSKETVQSIIAAPTKSRRKSSTPRKLHCTKTFNSVSVDRNSSNLLENIEKQTENTECQDAESEQQSLRWSEDGSQDSKNDINEIDKIKEFIETSVPEKLNEGSLHIDLVKRGFDVETAKSIERDLLDTTPVKETLPSDVTDKANTSSDKVESDNSFQSKNLQIEEKKEEYEEEVELSNYECDTETDNYISYEFDESKFIEKIIPKFKNKFSMEVCIEDGVSIRLRAMPFESLFEDSDEIHNDYNLKETEAAVESIANIDRLYTPMKDTRSQCYELFDSTLTSIDTPLKSESVYETTVTEIVLEVENVEENKTETKKRKRLQSGTSDESLIKKTKTDTKYLLNTANIQNIDIESVLSKLHGP